MCSGRPPGNVGAAVGLPGSLPSADGDPLRLTTTIPSWTPQSTAGLHGATSATMTRPVSSRSRAMPESALPNTKAHVPSAIAATSAAKRSR